MNNTIEEIGGMKVFSNPEDLAASMQQETVESTPQPEQTTESAPEPEPVVQTEQPQEPVSAEPEVASQPETQEYSESDYEQAVLSYMSERLGRQFVSFDEFGEPQKPALDERIEAIARFVQDTGRGPEDWFAYQSLNPSEMDDFTAIRVSMASQYPSLSNEELSVLVNSKYKVDPDLNTEEEVRLAQIQLKVDAQSARERINELRSQYQAPEVRQPEVESIIDDEWISSMSSNLDSMTGLEFDLGNDRSFTFGLDESYKSQLKQKNAQLDEFFDPYINSDGSWDHELLSSHRAVIDNIDAIVSSAYRQGLGDGQKNLVNKAANIQTQAPVENGVNQSNAVLDQLRSIIGDGNKMTFKI